MANSKILSGIILVLGIIIVGVGCHAYFESPFNKENSDKEMHTYCKLLAKCMSKTCPSAGLELYFVTISIIALLISGALFSASFFIVDNKSFQTGDSVLKAVMGILVFIGGITVIVSAGQINGLQNAILKSPTEANQCLRTPGIRNRQGPVDLTRSVSRNDPQYYDEKIAAGALSLINGAIYIIAAVIGFRS